MSPVRDLGPEEAARDLAGRLRAGGRTSAARWEAAAVAAYRRMTGAPILPDQERRFRLAFRRAMSGTNPPRRRKMTPAARQFVARAIRWHRADMPPKQAVAVALDEARRAGFRVPPRRRNTVLYRAVLTFPYWSDIEGFARTLPDDFPGIQTRRVGRQLIVTSGDLGLLRHVLALLRADAGYIHRSRIRAVRPASNPLTALEVVDVLSRAAEHRKQADALPPTSAMHAYGKGRQHAYEHVALLHGPKDVPLNPAPRNPYSFPAAYLDHGFWMISERTARALAAAEGKRLPRPGYELELTIGGLRHFLSRTPHRRGMVWAIRHPATSIESFEGRRWPNPLARTETAHVLRRLRTATSVAQMPRRFASHVPAPVEHQARARAHHVREAAKWGGRAYEAGAIADLYGAAKPGRGARGTLASLWRQNPPRVVGTIPGRMTRIDYERTGRYAGPYRHVFGRNVRAYRLSDGSVLLRGPKPLWVRQD